MNNNLNNTFGDNNLYPLVRNNDNYAKFEKPNGETGFHKFAKLTFLGKDVIHKPGSKDVACKLYCLVTFDVPEYWRNLLTEQTGFTVVGVSHCSDDDDFNLEKGKLIAQAKAENEAYTVARNMMKMLQRQLTNFAEALDKPIQSLVKYREHNLGFIEDVLDDKVELKH